MAGQPDAAKITAKAIDEQLDRFKAELHAANAANDGTAAAARAVALAQERMWNQQALRELEQRDMDAASKASREAVRHGELAVKLARSTIADRVAELERVQAQAKRKGRGIAQTARRRGKKT